MRWVNQQCIHLKAIPIGISVIAHHPWSSQIKNTILIDRVCIVVRNRRRIAHNNLKSKSPRASVAIIHCDENLINTITLGTTLTG